MVVDLKDIERRMDKALEVVRHEFSSLRTGRAAANMLDAVKVEAYGAEVPLNQVAGVSVPEARLLVVTVWDESLAKSVEKGIIDSRLGLTPQAEGHILRISVPELNEERRRDLAKLAGKYAEQGRVSVRNIRREAMDGLKRAEKDDSLGRDEMHKLSQRVQDLTDNKVGLIDSLLAEKETEITEI